MSNKLFSFFSKNSQPPAELVPWMQSWQLLPIAICVLEPSGKIVFANTAMEKLTGFQAGELAGHELEESGLTMADVEQLLRANGATKLCKEIVSHDKDSLLVSIGAVKLPELSYILLSFEENPDYYQVRDEKQFFQSVVRNYPLPVCVQDIQSNCRVWNSSLEQLFNKTESEALGHPVRELVPTELAGALEVLDREVISRQQICLDRQMTCKNKDGNEQMLSVSKVPLIKDKTVYAILTIFEDISARRKQERELLQTRNLLQAILDHVPLGIYTRTIDGEMTYFNRQSQIVLGQMDPKYVNSPHPKQDKNLVEGYASRERQIIAEGVLKDYPDENYIDEKGNEKIIHMIKVPLMQAGPEPLVLSIVEDVTKRREQEREIMTANDFLSAIFENAPVGLYARTKSGEMLLSNKMSEQIFQDEETQNEQGFSPHETKEQIQGYLNREAEVLASGEPLVIEEEPYKTADGKEHILHMVKVPVKAREGNSGFVITMVEDITKRKQQEHQLEEAHNFQKAILDNVPLGIYAFREDSSMVFVNKKTWAMFPEDDIYNEPGSAYAQRDKAVFEKGEIMDIPEEEYIGKNGDKMILHLIKVPVFDKDHKPYMLVSIAEDITLRKKQEKEISQAKNFLQKVVDNLPVALSVRKPDGKYIVWNKRSEDLFGVSAKEVIGQMNYRHDISKEQAEFMVESDRKVLESGRELNIAQELVSTPTEGVKIMHTVKTPLYSAEGEAEYLLNVSEDITVKTKMEKQVREANEKNSLLVESAREGILILEDRKIIYANQAVCKVLGSANPEELMGRKLSEFIASDYQLFAKEKYDSVISNLEGAEAPLQLRLNTAAQKVADVELTAMASKYLGRRIVIVFLRDITEVNRQLREIRAEREMFKNIFQASPTPAFVLNHKGYISMMNKSARDLFSFTEQDRNFYRNVYIRPELTLEVRRRVQQGQPAQMDYIFDFDKARAKFPDHIRGEGMLKLHVTLEPFSHRDTQEGHVEADYLVILHPQSDTIIPPPPPSRSAEELSSAVPATPVVLPNTDPYVMCSKEFKILSCNTAFCELCQLSKEELQGQEIVKLFHQDTIPLLMSDLRILVKKGAIENRDYRIYLASSLETAPVRVSVARMSDGNYLWVLHNMASQNQMMHILQERSAKLGALLEATDGAIFFVNFEGGRFGRIKQANQYMADLLGYSLDELGGLPFSRLFLSPANKNERIVVALLNRAAQVLHKEGKASVQTAVFTKKQQPIEMSITMVPLELPGENTVLVLMTDLSAVLRHVARHSKEASELRSMRRFLPGLYLRTDREGKVLEVSSNLSYLSDEEAKDIFYDKIPSQYWPWDTAEKELFSLKEALSVNISTHFDFEWNVKDKKRFFEAVCSPITGRDEIMIWVKDISAKRLHEQHIRQLYAISNKNTGTLTEQVNQILDFGKNIFKADVGIIMRFNEMNPDEMTVVYATQSDFNLERYMVFPVEECLLDVRDDNVVVFPKLSVTNCKRCIHKEKGFESLIAAPLYVSGKVMGTLCFASRQPRFQFEEGAEELIGIMSRILSLRIELREASKTLSENAQSFMSTLAYMDMPALVMDLKYQIRYANNMFSAVTGRQGPTEGKDFFMDFIRNPRGSRRNFEEAERLASGNAFQVQLDLVDEEGKYQPTGWDVFIMKDIRGEVEGYGLIGVRH